MRKNLKEARRSAGMTQKEVAEYLGMTERAYQNIEYGKALGKITHWDALEDLFGIPQRRLRAHDVHDKDCAQRDSQ
ncbi:MAG: helix-turn-helix transcriptional regulator [Lachnospiraceae bacterium]|jgi:transcriptional regulator with XRE-family HTH domain|nr:helix-turn-helix transcriptional regulator [Lachnospiraceae bacterium]